MLSLGLHSHKDGDAFNSVKYTWESVRKAQLANSKGVLLIVFKLMPEVFASLHKMERTFKKLKVDFDKLLQHPADNYQKVRQSLELLEEVAPILNKLASSKDNGGFFTRFYYLFATPRYTKYLRFASQYQALFKSAIQELDKPAFTPGKYFTKKTEQELWDKRHKEYAILK